MIRNYFKTAAILLSTVSFNCYLSAAINIGITPDNWSIGSGASISKAGPFQLQNHGESVRVNVRGSDANNWYLSNTPRLNAFSIDWSGDTTGFISTKDKTIYANIPAGETKNFVLTYHSPTYTTYTGDQSSGITFTAVSAYMGATWKLTPQSIPNDYYSNISVAMDSAGGFHEAFTSGNSGVNGSGNLAYADIGGEAELVGTDSVDTQDVRMNSPIQLVMDKNGSPHILYLAYVCDFPNSDPYSYRVVLQYAWLEINNGVKKWHIQTVQDIQNSNNYSGMVYALALDSENLPHVVYAGVNLGAFYTDSDGTNWTSPHPLTSGSYNNWMQICIKVDAANNSHIIFPDDPDGDGNPGLYYVTKNNGAWANVKTIAENAWPNSDLELDSRGIPYIALGVQKPDYTSVYYVAKLKSDGSWGELCQFDPNWGISSLTLDPNGYPNIVYADSSNTVVRYGQWTGVEWLSSDVWKQPSDLNTNLSWPIAGYKQNGVPVVSLFSLVYNQETSENAHVFTSARLE